MKIEEKKLENTTPIFGARFVDELKKVVQGLKCKIRLVAQKYTEKGSKIIPTKATTAHRFIELLSMSVAASLTKMKGYTRDLTQAYIQSKNRLERDVYIRPPPELGLAARIELKVLKPLYEIPESGIH